MRLLSLALVPAFLLLPIAAHAAPAPVRVLTTISTFNSFVRAVGGSHVIVDSLVPIGASPEDFQSTPDSIRRLHDADILFENGAGLELWLARTVENAANPHLRIVIGTHGIPLVDGNPHAWMDPVLAQRYVAAIRDALIAADPRDRKEFVSNAAAYDRRLEGLRREISSQIATIPRESRNMIVFHNAWQYYGDRFGVRIIGAIELAPGQEPNPQRIGELIDMANRMHVRAIFGEPEYSPKLAQTLADSAGIRTVVNLYDDSIGGNAQVSDYFSMLRYDTATIVEALGGTLR
ncbi:MAG TPA: metal ABC transporter substrate-binding protein [Candidatus Baltobacteraceae bacterium]|nr:metal ABC transporter substrate-binding protein [Candidatus Baltobacteraceae bacterium]